MKKLTIEITDAAHNELLKIQLEKKLAKNARSTVKDIAGDYLSECLEKRAEKSPAK
jgi:hypothetical protein